MKNGSSLQKHWNLLMYSRQTELKQLHYDLLVDNNETNYKILRSLVVFITELLGLTKKAFPLSLSKNIE